MLTKGWRGEMTRAPCPALSRPSLSPLAQPGVSPGWCLAFKALRGCEALGLLGYCSTAWKMNAYTSLSPALPLCPSLLLLSFFVWTPAVSASSLRLARHIRKVDPRCKQRAQEFM